MVKAERVEIRELKAADYTPRIMPDDEAAALRKSIATFGFVEPVIVNRHTCDQCGDRQNILVGGHQRVQAVLGDPRFEQIPAMIVDLHYPQEMQLNLALNKVGGRFDTVKLKKLVRDVQATSPNYDLTTTGFTPKEIANILAPVEMNEADAWAKVPDSDMPDYTTMSFTVSNSQAASILKAINDTRAKFNLQDEPTPEQQIGAALVVLAKHYTETYGQAD